MKITPYIHFGGNCAEAITFYEKAFSVKAEIMRYKDAPPNAKYQKETGSENYVMYAQFKLGINEVMFCDLPPSESIKVGNNIAVSVAFDDINTAKSVFEVLKADGIVTMEMQETFWSKCFGSVIDKFGVGWQITLDSKK